MCLYMTVQVVLSASAGHVTGRHLSSGFKTVRLPKRLVSQAQRVLLLNTISQLQTFSWGYF